MHKGALVLRCECVLQGAIASNSCRLHSEPRCVMSHRISHEQSFSQPHRPKIDPFLEGRRIDERGGDRTV